MSAWIDPIGNLVGQYEGSSPTAPCLLIGSHIDTVRDGGNYDGALGVMIGLECVDELSRTGRRLPFAIEVVAFGDEEGSRFATSMMCSRTLVGLEDLDLLNVQDSAGVSVREALNAFGLQPDRVADAARPPGSILAYVEPHIEQGPVLESEGQATGIVTGIAAQLRVRATITGMAGHAGTSPMGMRRDAVAAAAEAILAIERICGSGPPDLRGTVGRLLPKTSAYNVMAGEVELGIDLRAETEFVRDQAAAEIKEELEAICARRRCHFDLAVIQDLPATPCDLRLMSLLDFAVTSLGGRPLHLVSGAGHDAISFRGVCPVAMLFIRCAGGLSHHADESVTEEDVGAAVQVLSNFIESLACEHERAEVEQQA